MGFFQGRGQSEKARSVLPRSERAFTYSADFLEIYDDEHSEEENRFIAIGPIHAGVIVVIYTEPQDKIIRIVSARKATKNEVLLFHKHFGEHQ